MASQTINANGRNGENANGTHPEPIREPDLMWESLPPAVTQKLGEPLDEGLVSHRKGRKGRAFAYLEGRTAIDQANRILGFGGWGYELVGEVTLSPSRSVTSPTSSYPHPPKPSTLLAWSMAVRPSM